MTLVCIERPNRTKKREFTANDAGRIVCIVIESGVPRQEVIRQINRKCPKADVCDKTLVRQNVLIATGLFAALAIAIYVPLAAALAFLTTVILIAARFAPVLLRIRSFRQMVELFRQLPKTRAAFDEALKALENIVK